MDKPELLVMGVLPDWDLAPMAEHYTLRLLYEASDEEAFLAEHAPNISAIVTKGEIGAPAALMGRLPKLGLVACYGVGIDAIDKGWCAAHGIPVTNTPDVLTEDVADMAFALLLGVAREVPKADRWVRDGSWTKDGSMPLTTRVWGKRIGIEVLLYRGRIDFAAVIVGSQRSAGGRVFQIGVRDVPFAVVMSVVTRRAEPVSQRRHLTRAQPAHPGVVVHLADSVGLGHSVQVGVVSGEDRRPARHARK